MTFDRISRFLLVEMLKKMESNAPNGTNIISTYFVRFGLICIMFTRSLMTFGPFHLYFKFLQFSTYKSLSVLIFILIYIFNSKSYRFNLYCKSWVSDFSYFLLQTGRNEKAEKTFKLIARVNRIFCCTKRNSEPAAIYLKSETGVESEDYSHTKSDDAIEDFGKFSGKMRHKINKIFSRLKNNIIAVGDVFVI